MTNVLVESSSFPEFGRPDAGLVLISEWRTPDAERRQAVMDGVIDAWAEARLPESFLGRYCLVGSDGLTILNYAQWTDAAAHHAFAADPANQRAIAESVQALISVGPPGRYRYERSVVLREGPLRTLATAPSETGVAQYVHRGEDGKTVRVLTAHDDEGDGTTVRFRPCRGLVRPRG
ncbi:hypothetical protein [Streptomyces sp. NPDC053755]|uniref:hypothetical protein n=1 Tax=Streptomyces sp. NPDC053755 TaxID=3155815 RepID=UPI00342C91B3